MPDPYRVQMSRQAAGYYRRLNGQGRGRIDLMLTRIAASPRDPEHSTPMHGAFQDFRRARIGNLRIIFSIEDTIRVVSVSQIGPRGDIYGH